jgi:glutathione S-transferase
MSLTLYFHPLSSFCQKVLIALYENDIPFERQIVDLGDPASAAAFKKLWPIGRFPVLNDAARGEIVPESTVIIEYLARHYPGKTALVAEDSDLAQSTRAADRFYDLYVNVPMQKIVTDRLRPEGKQDRFGVEQSKALLQTACTLVDREMGSKRWAAGDDFSMADCAAAPPLFYANWLTPLAGTYDNAAAYLSRLMERPSFARALEEAKPYWHLFPGPDEAPQSDMSKRSA